MTTKQANVGTRSSTAYRWLAVSVAVLVTSLGGVLYGNYSSRWGPRPDLVAAGMELARLPDQIGNWKCVEDLPMNETALKMLECAGYVNRRYIDQESGESINLALIVGPPGPTAVHTPEICFSSRAYDLEGERQRFSLDDSDGRQHSFWFVDFTTRNPFADGLRIYYAWSPGGEWDATRSPRYEHAAEPLLYKIQLATPIPPGPKAEHASDPGQRFLHDLNKYYWSTSSKVALF